MVASRGDGAYELNVGEGRRGAVGQRGEAGVVDGSDGGDAEPLQPRAVVEQGRERGLVQGDGRSEHDHGLHLPSATKLKEALHPLHTCVSYDCATVRVVSCVARVCGVRRGTCEVTAAPRQKVRFSVDHRALAKPASVSSVVKCGPNVPTDSSRGQASTSIWHV